MAKKRFHYDFVKFSFAHIAFIMLEYYLVIILLTIGLGIGAWDCFLNIILTQERIGYWGNIMEVIQWRW
ncbi:hypothetical protein B1NLA3E_12565 [Bacillus sp. 1NLA3E]|nr:hypothetical protein B1NLA3E_12565 [Bacillus sp. 1NLA3E]